MILYIINFENILEKCFFDSKRLKTQVNICLFIFQVVMTCLIVNIVMTIHTENARHVLMDTDLTEWNANVRKFVSDNFTNLHIRKTTMIKYDLLVL